ncbi:TonB family protein [Aliikangiella coralliicola]|uniref:Protein TonB n=1 Tax=Aliikangiella coralliicola TaxID=2592383 RepID=A0A545UIX1_9GAMM|nr:TonB family protein [Aliikangiella coralliicola]TQV89424.1 TonB family protein [Aliikangiella coralliicola]
MMEQFVDILITKSVGMMLLLILILAARPAILRWLNAHVAYQLWLIVPVFILLPVNWIETNVMPQVMTFFPDADLSIPQIQSVNIEVDSQFSGHLLAIWLVGALMSLFFYVTQYRRLLQSFKKSAYQLPTELRKHQSNFNFNNLKTVNTKLINVPAILGVFKPYLILPEGFEKLTVNRQAIVLSHEFYHLRRRDYQVNMVRVLFKCIFWFNPFIFWADKYLEADQEMSCDLGVLQSSDDFGARQYGEALIDALIGSNQSGLVSQWNYTSLIKERVKMLKNIKQKKWHSWVVGVFAMASMWGASSVIGNETSVDTAVTPKKIIAPRYPAQAAMDGVEGWVRFQFDLENDGTPVNVKVIASEPEGIFNDAATDAFLQWTFITEDGAMENQRYTMEFKTGQ